MKIVKPRKEIVPITRENLLEFIELGLAKNLLTMASLEKKAGLPRDSIRDFMRGKTYILRADALQKVLLVLDPDDHLSWHVKLKN